MALDLVPSDVVAALPLVGGRPSLALNEVKRLLEVILPVAIDEYNALHATSITKPANVRMLPDTLKATDIDNLSIAATITTEPHGSSHFKKIIELTVYSVNQKIPDLANTSNARDRLGLIEAMFYLTRNGRVNPDNRRCWRALKPVGWVDLPGEWAAYTGAGAKFIIIQGPNEDSEWN